MDYDNLKKYISARINNALSISVYSKSPKFETTNNPENNTTEPYCLIQGLILIDKTAIKYIYNLELEFHDFTADSTTINDQVKLLTTDLDKSWQKEIDMFFRIDLSWQSDIAMLETPDKSRIDQRYIIQLYNN